MVVFVANGPAWASVILDMPPSVDEPPSSWLPKRVVKTVLFWRYPYLNQPEESFQAP